MMGRWEATTKDGTSHGTCGELFGDDDDAAR